MARIRSIKPEFWDSPSTAKASPWARLLYIAMWNWADDHGRGTANLKELEGFAFPNDNFPIHRCSGNTVVSHGKSVDFRDVVAEVSECFGVRFYSVDGRPFFAIESWDKHQRNERRAAESKYPPPPPLTSTNTTSSGDTVDSHGNTDVTHGASGPGTGEQGNRGTGEQGNRDTAPATAGAPPTPSRFDEFWSLYPRKQAKGDARKAWDAALKRVDQDVIIGGLRRLLPWFESQDKATGDYRPTAGPWLRQERWTDELIPERAPAGRAQQANEAVYATWDRQIEERRQAGLEPPLEITA